MHTNEPDNGLRPPTAPGDTSHIGAITLRDFLHKGRIRSRGPYGSPMAAGGLAALGTPEDAPNSPATEDAACLADLGAAWSGAKAEEAEAIKAAIEAENAATVLHPEVPAFIRHPRHPHITIDKPDLQRMDAEDRRLGRCTGSPRLEALDHWNAQCAAISSAFGVPALDQTVNTAGRRAKDLAERIAAIRPETAQDAALKFAVLLSHYGDGHGGIDEPEPIIAFLGDLEHLARLEWPGVTDRPEVQPPAPPERPSRELLETYNAWLFMERRLLAREMYPNIDPLQAERMVPCNAGDAWHFRGQQSWRDRPQPSSRAAMVLEAVGVIPEAGN